MAKAAGIDVHAHFFPETFIRAVEEAGASFGANVDRSNPKGPALVVGGSRTAPLEARYWDLDLRIALGLERLLAIIQAKATGLSRKDQERVVRRNAARMLHLE